MKLRERRLSALEARVPKKDDEAAAFKELLEWAVAEELDALAHIIERMHRGQPAAGDDALIEELTARWQARASDPTIELDRVHGATKRWHRDPTRRLIGGRWVDWLSAFDDRDAAGTATPQDWHQWHRLMDMVDRHLVRDAALPEGVTWGDGVPAALLEVAVDE